MTDIKKQLFEQLALIAHCLASPQRIELLDYLAQAERSVEELSQLSDLSTANTSRHLQVLKNNGLVDMRKQGKSRLYRIAGEDVILLLRHLRQSAEKHLAEVDRLMLDLVDEEDPSEVMSIEEILSHLKDDNFILLDVRPAKEYTQGHIQGAINIPPDTIDYAIKELPHNKALVAYCRGPYCRYSYKMVKVLRQNGVKAHRLEEGFPEWKAAGLPYEESIEKIQTH